MALCLCTGFQDCVQKGSRKTHVVNRAQTREANSSMSSPCCSGISCDGGCHLPWSGCSGWRLAQGLRGQRPLEQLVLAAVEEDSASASLP